MKRWWTAFLFVGVQVGTNSCLMWGVGMDSWVALLWASAATLGTLGILMLVTFTRESPPLLDKSVTSLRTVDVDN